VSVGVRPAKAKPKPAPVKSVANRYPLISKSRQSDLENQEALEAIENSEIREIHQIQEALKRISEGTYGICAHCGEDIDPKHLEALPTATRCISCAA
jgi:RNA polymerase-binding transcription factor DksA